MKRDPGPPRAVLMQVTVVLDHRFQAEGDGSIWTDGPFAYSFFRRYLEVFDAVRVVARAAPPDAVEAHAGGSLQRADGPGVKFAAVPCYIGPWQYLMRRGELRAAVGAALEQAREEDDAIILRIPSQLALLAFDALERSKSGFGAEVVADPLDAFAPGAARHPLRPLLRSQQSAALKRLCQAAAATAYVTERALQQRYPPAKGMFTTHYSSVELDDAAFVAGPPRPREPLSRLISVGSMEHTQKGQDTLLEALALCNERGLGLNLTLVGDGRMRPWFERRAQKLGVASATAFRGRVASGAAVRRELDASDLFVLPSRQEGLPRAMLEAMARGLPAVGCAVGGVPELLEAKWLAAPNDAQAIAERIAVFAERPAARIAQAAQNLERAHAYHNDRLEKRRAAFYREVRSLAAASYQAASRVA